MKKISLYLPIIILSLLMLFSFGHIFYIRNLNEKLNQHLKAAYSAAEKGNYEECKKYTDNFISDFEKAEPLLQMTIHHSELDNIKWTAERMRKYNTPEVIDQYLAENAVLQKMVKHLYTKEMIIPQNII